MLGSLGLWSSSKGMVLVPNLSGLTNTQAEAAIISAGLTYSGSSSTTTSNIALSNQVVSQLPNANELVPYGSDVSFIYYNYVATTTTTTTSGGGGGTPPPPVTTSAPVATISNLTYTKTGTTTGTLSWSGSNVNAYLFTGNSSLYPSPYNYGAYTATWPGNLVNLTEGQSYTVTITVINSAGAGNSQTITFTHPVVTTTSTTTTTTTLAPLTTPIIETFTGWQVYPGSVYATFNVMNFDYDATYTSSLGVRNPEFPEEWIAENLTPNQSYTVNITVSKPGYANSTGSSTFIANPANNPTTTTTTTVAPTTTTTTTAGTPAPTTTTTTTTTAAPGEFTISSISSTTNSITYSWSNPPAGTAFYTVQYSDNDVVYQSETTGSTSKTFTGLAPNTPHTVFVTARNSSNGYLADANASISTQAVAATTTTTTTGSASVPSGGSVSLSGGNTPGSLITASTSGWSGSPTSYSVIITTSTSGTPTATDTVVASGIGNSASYTITSTDAVSPVNIFRAFATATNASGTSAQVASGTISAEPPATTAAPTYSRNEVRSTSAGQCPSLNGNYTVTYSNSNYTGEISAVFTSCVGVTTTTTVAPATTTTTTTASAATTTTTTGLDCSGNTCDPERSYTGTRSVSTSVCASGTMNTYTCWTPGTCANVTTDTGCVPTGSTTTTTTAAAEEYRLCTSFNVANQDCVSQGCSSGGCGSGSICTSGIEYRCAYI